MLSVLGKLLGAIGLAATPSTLGDSSLVTSYKAPRDNQVGTILRYGFMKKLLFPLVQQGFLNFHPCLLLILFHLIVLDCTMSLGFTKDN